MKTKIVAIMLVLALALTGCVSADVDVIMTLCFMSLPVIPKLKLLDTGLFDVEAFDFVPIEL